MKWSKVSDSKEQVGLGILQIDHLNKALLMKWWWKMLVSLEKKVCGILRENMGINMEYGEMRVQ